MRTYKNIRQAVLSLAVDHETKVIHMLVKACKNEVFKKPFTEDQYSHQWLKHHLYEQPKIKVFKMLLSTFPPMHDFQIKGFEEEFLVDVQE